MSRRLTPEKRQNNISSKWYSEYLSIRILTSMKRLLVLLSRANLFTMVSTLKKVVKLSSSCKKSGRIKFLSFLLMGLALTSVPVPANAVTFGQEETSASTQFPWVVPVIYFEKDATEPSGLCTGTLIRLDVVLTAAHCIPSEGFFEIKYGITALEESDKNYSVKATWIHPRYSKSKFGVNDIGLLKLNEPINGAKTLPIASSKELKKAELSKDIRILGWGEDQNGDVSTYLRSAKLSNQSAYLSKLLGKKFNKATWVAAGRYNSVERVYAGGCRGDSGGPLVSKVGNSFVQLGITSFGAENCETEVPTIFMKVAYFSSDIANAIKQLNLNAIVNDRSPALNLTKPTISGEARVGSRITCNSGNWSENVGALKYEWFHSQSLSISESPILEVSEDLAGKSLKCVVTGTSKVNSVSASVEMQIPSKLIVLTQAKISGLPTNGYDVAPQNVINCEAGTATGLVESSTFYWIIRNNTSDTTGTNLGSTQSINLPSSFFITNGQKDLVCVNVMTGPGGTVRAQANGMIYAPQIPSVYSVSYKGFNQYYGSNADAWIGTTLTCEASSSLPSRNSNSLSYSWRLYETNAPYAPSDSTPSRVIANGPTLILTEGILKDAVTKRIGCAATATSLAGSATGYSSTSYVDYRNIAVPDLSPPTYSLVLVKPWTDKYKLGERIALEFISGDAAGLAMYQPFEIKLIANSYTQVPVTLNPIQTYPGGTKLATQYYLNIFIPSANAGGVLGSYQLSIRITDAKNNQTDWIVVTNFEIQG